MSKIKNSPCPIVLLFCSLLILGCSNTANTEKPNLVFILVDDLGYADLGYNGSNSYESPNVDALAAEGMVFTNAYAASPVCSPTRAAILSGKYPARLHLTDWIPGNRHYGPHKHQKLASQPFELQLPLEEYTLAEAFKDAGYKTLFAGKWHLGEKDEYYPQFQGFDINRGGNQTGHPSGGYFSPYENPQLTDGPKDEYLTDRLTDEVIQFVDANKDAPFFAYLSFYTVHLPMQGKPEKVKKYTQKFSERFTDEESFSQDGGTFYKHRQNKPQYAAMIESMDENVGRLLQCLEKNGLTENTIIVFTSDNGGMATSNAMEQIPTSNLPLRAGKGYLYEGGIREPFIIKWPKRIPEGSSSHFPVTSTDLYPTLLDIAGMDRVPHQHKDGISLKPILEGKNQTTRPIFWHYPHYSGGLGGRPSGAVRLGDYKLIEFYEDMNVELYDVRKDIGEQNDLSKAAPEKVKELVDLLHQWRNEVGAQMPHPNPHFEQR